jgi:hypothetical protein
MAGGRVDAGSVRGNRLVPWGERRLEHHASGRLGSLVLGGLRRFAESSRNSGSALVLNVFLSVVPALLAVYALADLLGKNDHGIARHLAVHLHLHRTTATLVLGTFGTVAHRGGRLHHRPAGFSHLRAGSWEAPSGRLRPGLARPWRLAEGPVALRALVHYRDDPVGSAGERGDVRLIAGLGAARPDLARRPGRLLALDAVASAAPSDQAAPAASPAPSWSLSPTHLPRASPSSSSAAGSTKRTLLRLFWRRHRPPDVGAGAIRDLARLRRRLSRLRRMAGRLEARRSLALHLP